MINVKRKYIVNNNSKIIYKKGYICENNKKGGSIKNNNKCWSHIAPFSRLYLVKLKVIVQLDLQQ